MFAVQTESQLKYDTVFAILMEKILPLLGVRVPEKRAKNTTGVKQDYADFMNKLQKYIDQLVDISDLMDNPSDVVQAEYAETTNFKNGLMVSFESFFNAMHNAYFEQLMIEA